MSITEVKVSLSDLKSGMFVSRLDRPWLESPYKVQGFLIKGEEDIGRLQKYCKYVYIDTKKSSDLQENLATAAKVLSDNEQKHLLINAQPKEYPNKSGFKSELKIAYTEHAILSKAIAGVMEQVTKNNKLDLPTIRKAVMPMVESVIRNPDAFSWLTMMKRRDDYAYTHSVSSSIWAAAFGRNLGLPIKKIHTLVVGALLFDVGKTKLPEKLILNLNQYNAVEHNLIKKHVEYSLDIVKSIEGIEDDIYEMIATHHERHDGSGYPRGLKGNEIPLFGKMAGIIDCYDAIISERLHAPAMSPHDAIKNLYNWSGNEFQAELIEQFIQVVGVYPVGTLVELSDGRVGVVIAHNQVRRLKPRIMLVLNKDKALYKQFDTINLLKQTEGEDGQSLNIVKTVDPGKYGIDPNQFYL
jgi:HD-GYP domain-containing protein (c-di-GMP phosphodiesterase class II)